MAWLYSSLKGDKALYLLMTQNLLQGKGLTESVSLVETGKSVALYDGGVHSPLYPLLCAPFLWLTKSYFVTQLLVSWVGWIAFFIGLYRLALRLLPQRWVVNIFILCVGGFIYPQEMQSAPKDTIAAALTLWSVVLIHRFVIHQPTALLGAGIGALLAGLCSIKITYLSIAIVLFVLLLALTVSKWRKQALQPVSVLLLCLLVGGGIYAYFVLPYYQAVRPTALPSDSDPYRYGFFPQNLLASYPFVSSAVVETQLVAMQAELWKPGSFSKAMSFFRWIDLAMVALLMGTAVVCHKRLWKDKAFLLLLAASVAVVAGVVYKSVVQEAVRYKSSIGDWIYVSDARNFLVPMLLLQVVLFRFVVGEKRMPVLRLLLLILFAGSAAHGYLFATKMFVRTPFVAEANVNRDGLKNTVDYLKKEPDVPLITSDKALRRYAAVNGLQTYSFSDKEPALEWMKSGDRFVVATHTADSMYLQKLPRKDLALVDTMAPFIIHQFTKR